MKARQLAKRVGTPLVAGTQDPVNSVDDVMKFAEQYGLPLVIKAAYGGGGRGMKVVWRREDIPELYVSAVREAVTAFGRGECFIERFLDRPRHIEAQVLADKYGNVQVLGTRDCSLQRRNQKLIEEAPAPFLSDEQRQRIHDAARELCREAAYCGAGTVEFLLSPEGEFSFLEVNTRLQVEHTVTEETTGIDLVIAQLRSPGANGWTIPKLRLRTAMLLSFVSMPKILRVDFFLFPARSVTFHRRPALVSVWTAESGPVRQCRPLLILCWQNLSSGRHRAKCACASSTRSC